MHPPSFPDDVKARAFRAGNGELGIHPADAPVFLDACRFDRVEVRGWELWIVDHEWDFGNNVPVPASGRWCGLIPVKDGDAPAVIGGRGNLAETERQLGAIDLEAEVPTEWLPYMRVNFTLVD